MKFRTLLARFRGRLSSQSQVRLAGAAAGRRLISNPVEATELQRLRLDLLEESQMDFTYLVLIVGSCIIATLGLLSNSVAVIIGAMLVAPLMLPIRGMAFGALGADIPLFRQGLISVLVGTLIAFGLSWFLGVVAGISVFGSEILARSQPNLLDLGIAIAAGGISGYAKIQPKISGSLAGTAIAVALMPPVCVIGLGLSHGDKLLSLGALLLYMTNLLGIALSCMVTFLLAGYAPLAQARGGLMLATALTGLLLIPLGVSFIDLVQQSRLQASLKNALVRQTVTFQRVELVNTETNWLVNPPEVRLSVRSQEEITPKQVKLLEEFIGQSMGQPFTLIFEVSQVGVVRRDDAIPLQP
ncbi:MAG: DUF389 domain-containing protein [Pegethrix bostrychoides GSE-TBD4-15B]|jgi:uncharacterized hydrophobic protein (TIGR00271 family)|uniref:DUF389 domain-containing protein n=1 Tax=Pegethrix bostrychoides GSE-TBD4-15B TaxID=2839662 RepID=A0A951PA40_9CYAN|nr:DUF389 domain-containing protein [Pegethrix bostrychoides GSE-TBD4-15B]